MRGVSLPGEVGRLRQSGMGALLSLRSWLRVGLMGITGFYSTGP